MTLGSLRQDRSDLASLVDDIVILAKWWHRHVRVSCLHP